MVIGVWIKNEMFRLTKKKYPDITDYNLITSKALILKALFQRCNNIN